VHCGPGPIPLFLKERQSLQSRTDPGTLGGASSNIRPRESGTSRAQALRIESLRDKLVKVVYDVSPPGNEWRCIAFPLRHHW
jgi:hypothetical protein